MTRIAAFNRLRFARFLAACFVAFVFAAPARAASVLPLFLEELVDTSAVVFEGTCIGNRTERDPGTNLVVTYTTFQVTEILKGNTGFSHVIKQVGGTLPHENLQFNVNGIPKFTPGESYVVFLPQASSAGFSSPVGLAQGRFTIKQGPLGREVTNGRDFKELTSRLPVQALAGGTTKGLRETPGAQRHLDIDEFKRLVRGVAGGKAK